MEMVPLLLNAGVRVIDLSADYRLKNIKVYERFYNVEHKDKINLKKAVYGLPELYRNKIKNASLVANPGCYPTPAILALAPLVACDLADLGSIIIDAKSGSSGAGKKLSEGALFSEVNEDFKAYKVNIHQHIPEINQALSRLAIKKINVTFVPHLLPVTRGILETIYVRRSPGQCQGKLITSGGGKAGRPQDLKVQRPQDLINLYKRFYKNEPFVRIRDEGDFPRLKDVVGTNFCDIGIKESREMLIIIAAIDNLMKGASSQAVQNMNIMYKFAEIAGLV
jgi:N-acetyl-gamma-glutamyl-phosphate reductase